MKADNMGFLNQLRLIKEKVKLLLEEGDTEQAETYLSEYCAIMPEDIEGYSMRAILCFINGDNNEAISILDEGLAIDSMNSDLLYNKGYIKEHLNELQDAIYLYNLAGLLSPAVDQIKEIEDRVSSLIEDYALTAFSKKRIVFFVKEGMDSFLGDIILYLSYSYDVRKVTVSSLEQISGHMDWADICWFEWCDELVVYGSNLPLAKTKKVFCRIHRYEVFTNVPQKVNWSNIDVLIIVADHLKKLLEISVPQISSTTKVITINNGVDLQRFTLKQRTQGFNLSYIGYIHSRKNPSLLLQIISRLVSYDRRYKLFLAGAFQEPIIELYWKYQIEQLGLEKNVVFDGWQNNIGDWLEDKQFIISTSIHESFGYGIAEAMSRGIKPVIHNFLYGTDIWDSAYLFNTVEEAVKMILSNDYDSNNYRQYINDNYSLISQISAIKKAIFSEMYTIPSTTFEYLGKTIKFYLPNLNDFIQNIIFHHKSFYELDMLEHIRVTSSKGNNIVDVGANIGNHTVYFAKGCNAKKVFSFEPQPAVFEILKNNIEINDLTNSVSLYNLALGERKSKGKIKLVNENNSGMSKVNACEDGEISIDTLDNLLLPLKVRIDLIKIDVEGMAINVLQGSLAVIKKYKPQIYVEAETEEEFIKLRVLLGRYGYEAKKRFNATPTYWFIAN